MTLTRLPLAVAAAIIVSLSNAAPALAQTDEHEGHNHPPQRDEPAAVEPADPAVSLETSSGQKLAAFLAETITGLDRSPLRRRAATLRELADATAARAGLIEDDPEFEGALRHFLGTLYVATGDVRSAEAQLQQALEIRESWLGQDHEDTIATVRTLGALALQMRQLTRADALGQMVLRRYGRIAPPDHRGRLQGLADLAAVCARRGRAGEAEQMLREALEVERASGRPVDGFSVAVLEQLTSMLLAEHRFGDVIPVINELIDAQRAAYGPADMRTLQTMDMLVGLLVSEKRMAEARPILRDLVAQLTTVMGETDPEVLDTTFALADAALAANDLAEAETLHRRVLELRSSALGPDHPRVTESRSGLAAVLERSGRWSDAEALRRAVWERHERIQGADHAMTLIARVNLARTLIPLKRYDECETLLIPALEKLGEVTGAGDPRRRAAALAAAELYAAWGRPADADRYRHQATPP